MATEGKGEDGYAGPLRARALAERAEHKIEAARLPVGGRFAEEACARAMDAICLTAGCLAAVAAEVEPEDAEEAAVFRAQRNPAGVVDAAALDTVRVLSGDTGEADPVETAAAFPDRVSTRIEETQMPPHCRSGRGAFRGPGDSRKRGTPSPPCLPLTPAPARLRP